MQIAIIDSHAHVQFPAYDSDRDPVMRRALDVGIGVINIGTQYSTSEEAVRLAGRYHDCVWAAVGFHPGHVDSNSHHDSLELREKQQEVFDYQKFLDLARRPKVVAVGECGLDYYRIKNHESEIAERQQEVFRQQIELAAEAGRPLVIHCRNAFRDLIQILDSCFKTHDSRSCGVVHFFSGSWEDAKKLLDLGFCLGFGGVITFTRDYDEIVKRAPFDRILVETDAPYVAPAPYRGKRNEPAYIMETVKKIAELRGIGYDNVVAQTLQNTKTIFGL